MATVNGTAYTYNGSVASGYTYWIEYTYTQNISANTSTVTVKSFIKSNGSHSTVSSQWAATICGTTYATQSLTVGSSTTTHQLGGTKTFTVNHNADGTGTFSLSASYTNGLTSQSSYTTKKGSITTQTITLPTIPRASSIGTITGTTIGGNMTVNINRASSSFTHKIRLHFGSYNTEVHSNAGASGTFTLSLALIKQIQAQSNGVGTIYVQTYNGSTKIGSEVGKTVTLYAPVSSIGNYTGSTTIGSNLTVNVTQANSNIKHWAYLDFGNLTKAIATEFNTSTGAWALPTDLANQIPNTTSGTGTVRVTAWWKEGTTWYQCGPTLTKSITLSVPSSMVPTATGLTLTPVTETTLSGYMVAGKSRLRAQMVGASGSHGSTIKTYSISGQNLSLSVSDGYSNTITASGVFTYTATATDSRGRTVTKTASITVHAYYTPIINNLKLERCLENGALDNNGSYGKISFNANVYDIAGAAINRKQWSLEYRVANGVWSTNWQSGTLTKYGGEDIVIPPSANWDISLSWEIRLTLHDSYSTPYANASMSTVSCAFNIEEGGVGIGKYHERGALDVGGDIYSNGMVRVVGSSDGGSVGFEDVNGVYVGIEAYKGSDGSYTPMIRTGGSADKNIDVRGLGNSLRAIFYPNGNFQAMGAIYSTGIFASDSDGFIKMRNSVKFSGYVDMPHNASVRAARSDGIMVDMIWVNNSIMYIGNKADNIRAYTTLAPATNNGPALGRPDLRWSTVYSVAALNTCDSSYKENIKCLNSPIMLLNNERTYSDKVYDFIKNMPLYSYDYKEMEFGQHQIGFLADEILNLNPEIAGTFIYEHEDGNMTSTHAYVSNIHLALQETMQKVDRLEKLVETLLNEKGHSMSGL